jgi:hypothetical protein
VEPPLLRRGSNSERKLQCQLDNTRVYSRAANDAECRRGEVGVRVSKLRMVEGVVELGAKLKTGSFTGPFDLYSF